jgi:hypothetical protein
MDPEQNGFGDIVLFQDRLNCRRQQSQPTRSELGVADASGKRSAGTDRRLNRLPQGPAGNAFRESFSAFAVGTRNMISIPISSDFML